MARYIDADALKERLEDFSKWCRDGRKQGVDFVLDCPLPNMPTADVAPRAEVFEAVDKFRNDLMDQFIDLCRGNDYNKINLLKIGETVDRIYDKHIKELEKGDAE